MGETRGKKAIAGLALASALLLGTAGMASADEGRQGNNACYGISGAGGMEFSNPGEMFRYIREYSGLNPAEWIEARQAQTVGEFIYNRCVFHNPDA